MAVFGGVNPPCGVLRRYEKMKKTTKMLIWWGMYTAGIAAGISYIIYLILFSV